ncbi:NOP2 [Candida jiufengensis]|uniref:NOP2 n=1 Tax=Candida jiufengensis TaxID=497108 RepID=UPI002224BFEB|nr:NOP2 [Candida jiufengensis]KAI5954308.1 NOP2 [Candida jiufengensis]
MGRRAKNKQGLPPTYDEFQASKENKVNKKRKTTDEIKPISNKKQKNEKSTTPKSTKSSKDDKKTKQSKKPSREREEEEVEEDENLPEVDLEELASARKSLFDESDEEGDQEEELNDEFDIENGDYEGGEDLDSDEEDRVKHMFSDDDEDDEDLEGLNAQNMELYSKQLDEEEAEEAEDAEKELLEEGLVQPRAKVLPTTEEEEIMSQGPQDVTMVRTRMLEIVKVLENFKTLAEEGKSRAEYVTRLIKDICEYFGYSEFLADKLFNLFSPAEAIEFFEANEIARPITIRTNTLKTRRRDLAQALVNRGVNLQPIGSWTKVGLQIFDSQVPIGATPEYLAGHYILQAASSFLPVMALDPQENERILDMAAAPGGKTTYISALMKNTGCVFANDANKARTKSLIANIHRLGCKNTIVCNYDAREFPKVIGGFDRILLDAPCSGTGVIAKDESVKVSRTEKDFMQIPHLQKQLLLSAIDSVDANSPTGGVIVYSTCSIAVDENESVVDYALRKRPNVKLVETGLAIGKEGFMSYRGKHFNPSLKLTRRYYPHTYNVDGFYVAKFKKIAPSPHDVSKAGAREKENAARAEAEEEGIIHDDFATFDNEEDNVIMEKSKKVSLRKKGINPNATK